MPMVSKMSDKETSQTDSVESVLAARFRDDSNQSNEGFCCMKVKLSSLVCACLVLGASAAGQTATPTTSPNSTPARVSIPDTPGKTFDLAWVGKIVRVSDPQIAPDGKSLVTAVTKP